MIKSASYLSFFSNRRGVIKEAKKVLKDKPFDSILCTGVSGLSVAAVMCYILGKNLMYCRKNKDCHSTYDVEGLILNGSKDFVNDILFLDDFCSSGETLNRAITKTMEAYKNHKPKTKARIVGAYLYNHNSFIETDDINEILEPKFKIKKFKNFK